MAAPETVALIERYYAAFNDGDSEGMLACLSEDVAHDVNQGSRRSGKGAFREFTKHMERCYAEQLENMTIMATRRRHARGGRVPGAGNLHRDRRRPAAGRGQTYTLPAGTFFEVRDGLIARVTTYYNLADWLAQIAAPKP